MSGDSIEFHRSGEWTGVYLNGELVRYGDHYLADEWLQERASVTVVYESPWLEDGQRPRQTLAEVAQAGRHRELSRKTAAHLREQAEKFMAEAAAIEKEAGL